MADFDTIYTELRHLLAGRPLPQQRAPSQGGLPDYGYGPVTQASREGEMAPQLGQGPVSEQDPADAFWAAVTGPARVATDVAAQPVRAGEAVAEAYQDPSLANVTNAGFQSGMAVLRPAAALGMLGAGYAEATRRDLGVGAAGPAEAQQKKKTAQPTRTYEGLNADQSRRLDELRGKIEARSASRAEREEFAGLNAIVTDLQRQRNTAGQGEYNQAVDRAEQAFKIEKARDTRFADSEVGKMMGVTGGLNPILAGIGVGGLSRLATGGKNALYNYALPAAEGFGAGATAGNVPLIGDMLYAPAANPEKAAWRAKAHELPPTHPRKAEFTDYADKLPDENQVRKEASDEFYGNFLERTGAAGLEGMLGGLVGSNAVRVGGRGWNALMSPFARNEKAPAQAAENMLMKIKDKNGVTRYYDTVDKKWVKQPDAD